MFLTENMGSSLKQHSTELLARPGDAFRRLRWEDLKF
jgi:hypothetical protein